VENGGTFMVAASLAPFSPVKDDPAGCRQNRDAERARATCPLYAFAFVPTGDARRIAGTLNSVFEHLYVWPVPAIRSGDLTVVPLEQRQELTLDRSWGRSSQGAPIARVRGTAAVNQPLEVRMLLRDSLSVDGRLEAAVLNGQELRLSLAVRPLSLPVQPWTSAGGPSALIRPVVGKPRRLEVLSHGAEAPRYLYSAEWRPGGAPAWLQDFDGQSAADDVRTFGLGLLFTAFRNWGGKPPPPVGRLYFVVN
jgi:hypothetical protein